MKSPYRALIWEQWRTAGILSLCINGIALFLLVSLWSGLLSGQIHALDVYDGASTALLCALLVMAVVFLVRQNGLGHLALDFEPRLLHLPVVLWPVVVLVLAVRLLFLVLSATVMFVAVSLLFNQPPEWALLVAPVNFYVCAQAFTWSRRSITGLAYTLPLGLLILAGLLVLWGVETRLLVSTVADSLPWFAHPLSLVATIPLCVAFTCLSVFLQRRDARFGLPPAGDLFVWLTEFRAPRARTFASSFDAQLWFEQRRFGRLLPVLTVVFTLAFGLLFTMAPQIAYDIQLRYALAPFAGLATAALICGRIGLRPRSRFAFHRAQTTTHLSMAILCVQIRAMFFCFLLVSALALLGLMLSGHDGFLFVRMLHEGDLDWIGAAAILLRPAIAFTLIAWAMLWISTLPMLLPVLTLLGSFAVFMLEGWLTHHQQTLQGDALLLRWSVDVFGARGALIDVHRFVLLELRQIIAFVEYTGIMFPAIAMLVFVFLLALVATLKHRLWVYGYLFVGILLWQNLTWLLIAGSPGMPLDWMGTIACPVVALFVLLPLIAAPLSVFRYKCKG